MPPKKKQEKMSLGTFLGDQSLGSWADEMETMPMPEPRPGYGMGERRDFGSRSGYGADRDYGDRSYPPREALPLPNKPPFTAHLGNLSFDVTVGDIQDFFAACAVTNVRIVEDKLDRKPKGFGYVEYGTLDGLKKALELNGAQFQGRNIRISVAEPPKDRQDAREISDWTRKGPLPDLPSTSRRPMDRGFRSFDAASDAGSERSTSRRGPSNLDQGDGKVRDFGNWERKGPLSPTSPMAEPAREDSRIRRNDMSMDRTISSNWGEGRTSEGSRPPRRDPAQAPPVERTPTAAEMDSQWRSRMQPDAPPKSSVPSTPDVSTPSSPLASGPPPPSVRPRLNLQKRTISEAPAPAPDQAPSSTSDSKASPFGAARPIDTAVREKEIEEKREALRLKKVEEDKAREEKRLAEKAEKTERSEPSERAERPERPDRGERGERPGRSERPERAERSERGERAPKGERVTSPISQENGKSFHSKDAGNKGDKDGSERAPGMNYEILRRVADEGNGEIPPEVANEEEIEPANGAISEDKSVKPQEVTRDLDGSNQTDGQTTTAALQEEGWSTVSNTRSVKKGRGGARAAIAS